MWLLYDVTDLTKVASKYVTNGSYMFILLGSDALSLRIITAVEKRADFRVIGGTLAQHIPCSMAGAI